MLKPVLGAVVSVILTASANAGLVHIEFNDPVGTHWTGTVDTTADTLTINTWVENPGGFDLWTPASLPMDPWPARDTNGSLVDVPDAFDGTIPLTYGFISPGTLSDINWNEGTSFLFNSYVGWGATRSFDNYVVETDETSLGFVPENPASARGAVGVVTVVPEPSTLALAGLCVLGLFSYGWRRQRRA